ncbi:MAG: (d)CMP kinase [FCB group bacterium]|nr:(d)CMP kinase [FCB group bacterium]
MIIAIDGPSASGKSTTAKLVAKKLNFLHIDTGAMYRAVTLYFLDHKVSLKNPTQIQHSLDNIDLKLSTDGKLFLNGRDVSETIRENPVTNFVSQVSSISAVRDRMVDLQRKLSRNHNVVMEGRDIGTRVFPDADYKIFIVADVDIRSKRRYLEMREKGVKISYESILKDLIERDRIDSTREHSPLKKADDAIVIDTTRLTIEEQVEKIIDIVQGNH